MESSRRRIGVLVAGLSLSLFMAAVAAAEVISVEPGEDTLLEAVVAAAPGDELVLEPGLYEVSTTVLIDKDLTIVGATGNPEDVHIIAFDVEEFNFRFDEPPFVDDPMKNLGHILFATEGAEQVKFGFFTVKNAPENPLLNEGAEGPCTDDPPLGLGLNLTECFGDGIHADGVGRVRVKHVVASLNAGNGIFIDGADEGELGYVHGVNNGAFGIDVDTALNLEIRNSKFIANQISGVEASGHVLETARADYSADVRIKDVLAEGNAEIGIEVERFEKARISEVLCIDNREDGFDADRISELEIWDSKFINNLDDGIELFPVNVAEPEQPADFPGSIIQSFDNLEFSGNAGEEIHNADTEN